jgi:ubiquinone/menaquinone biosynthesis C-methylase UbiE
MIRRRILLTVFDLLYTRFAWAYDPVAWLVSGGLWYRWAEQVVPLVEQGPVLEVGCGRGKVLDLLARTGCRVTGVDRSMQMARHAARRSGQPVAQASGQALPFPQGHFATLITTFPAPYVLDPQTHREFARVVPPGGQWIWVDAPVLDVHRHTLLARVLTRLAWGGSDSTVSAVGRLMPDLSDGLWDIELKRAGVGASTVMVRVARRKDGPEDPDARCSV